MFPSPLPQPRPRAPDVLELCDWLGAGQGKQAEVTHWLSGKGGVSAAKAELPYLPPNTCNMKSLRVLLLRKEQLLSDAAHLLRVTTQRGGVKAGIKAELHQTEAAMAKQEESANQTQESHQKQTNEEQGASTHQANQREPSSNQDKIKDGEAELTEELRRIVRERFSSDPAHQLLLARFLSLFTMPALLASLHPIIGQDKEEAESDSLFGEGEGS